MKIDSLILRTTVRYLFPILLLFSAFIFWRGHNEPGGGFIAGLVASAAYALFSIACGAGEARRVLGIETRLLIGSGLLTALLSGLPGLLTGGSFLTGMWTNLTITGMIDIKIGTPVLFDIGVFLAVMGVTLTIIFALEEVE
ncbi:MAG: Na+/H+ antiporter subunit B [Anaerolineales bacterium]|jgi:multicomponent Na+:H+ antiporter subunit B|nr:Na+/H+ antiporter subunit B [Anaerolineales bacterium]